MVIPISIQLYTVRNEMANSNHLSILGRIARIGYKAVESGPGSGMNAAQFRNAVDQFGMQVSAYSCAFPTPETLQETIDTAKILGTDLLMAGFWIPDYESVEAIKRTAEKVNAVLPGLEAAGLTMCLHNHWFEFQPVEGRLAIEWLLDDCPNLKLEMDVYWAAAFGANDPAAMLAKYADRTPMIHVKDGPLVQGQPHQAVGAGKQDIGAIMAAADPSVLRWATVELDECATDMMQAVEESYKYLVQGGFCTGNR
ncbi:MAG: sugar phosphate isomerase/epimerase [Armatimonadetes bacterium]|nr:sugar phosphate isomerase/epimerase [Armatimonadota bacterium]